MIMYLYHAAKWSKEVLRFFEFFVNGDFVESHYSSAERCSKMCSRTAGKSDLWRG